ncbi:uncharacterized protein LOC105834037 isoform X2 [Monomorium pharaonis]|uniref:uncharacterized protein LOC105834037 isoform X2 n=1 Tax=Monomorium pharaonis TaxID=307658 RepID=UPI001745D99D|nr:uncharacterized protein LOC105834037 isoform X2 [Monomorium pharaonis]
MSDYRATEKADRSARDISTVRLAKEEKPSNEYFNGVRITCRFKMMFDFWAHLGYTRARCRFIMLRGGCNNKEERKAKSQQRKADKIQDRRGEGPGWREAENERVTVFARWRVRCCILCTLRDTSIVRPPSSSFRFLSLPGCKDSTEEIRTTGVTKDSIIYTSLTGAKGTEGIKRSRCGGQWHLIELHPG